jgi:hypothetical protein
MTATLLDMVGQDRRGRGVCELVTKPLADRAAQTGLRWRRPAIEIWPILSRSAAR